MQKLLVLFFATSLCVQVHAESAQYQLGQEAGYVVLECYKLVDLQKRYCPKFPATPLRQCMEVSTNFLPSKLQEQLLAGFINKPEWVQKYELQSRYENDMSFSETLKETKQDKDTACKNQWTAILYFREEHIRKAKLLLNK